MHLSYRSFGNIHGDALHCTIKIVFGGKEEEEDSVQITATLVDVLKHIEFIWTESAAVAVAVAAAASVTSMYSLNFV